MAIARKPAGKLSASIDRAAERFISGAEKAAASVGNGESSSGEGKRRVPTMIRFDAGLLERVDRAAKRRSISRSAWIQFTLSRALEDER